MPKFLNYKNSSKCLNMFWFLLQHVCISKYNTVTCRILEILWDFIKVKMPSFSIPKSYFLASAGRPGRSTEQRVGRPTRSTDVHRCARQFGWRACRPTRSTARELLLSGKPRSTRPVNRQRALLSVPDLGRPGRSTAGSTVRNLTVGRSTGRSTDRSSWLPTASFWSPINWDFWGLFSTRF